MKYSLSFAAAAVGVASFTFIGAAFAADKPVATVSVAPTKPKGSIAYWQPAMGEGLAQMMVTKLSTLSNMKVLESLHLDDLRSERQFGENGEVSDSESVKKGAWKGSDYTFVTEVTRFGSKENTYGGGGWVPGIPVVGHVAIKKSQNEVQLVWRIIDNATREIVPGASGEAVGQENGTGFNFSSWHGGGFSNNREFMDSALGKATVKAIDQIVEKVKVLNLAPGTRQAINDSIAAEKRSALRSIKGAVTLVDGKEVWVSLGAKNGFARGDKVKIYKPVEKKNSKGVVVTTTYQLVGEITLTKVQKEKSMGEYNGATQVSEDFAAADADVDIEKLD
jgi:curli biogenesis system outer membrane secretion channel CsgG